MPIFENSYLHFEFSERLFKRLFSVETRTWYWYRVLVMRLQDTNALSLLNIALNKAK